MVYSTMVVGQPSSGSRHLLSCHRFVNRVRLSLFILAYNLGLRRLCLPKAVKHWSLRSVQDRPSGAALPSIDLSVVRGVGSSTVVPRSGIVSAGYRRRQAEGGYNHDFAKRGSAPGSRLVFNALSPLAGDPKRTKTDKKHGSRQESHPLSDRPTIDWPCRT